MRLLFSILTIVLYTNSAYGQCEGWNWPEDEQLKKEAMSKNASYTDALKMQDYVTAQASHAWLLQNNPQLNTSIYINGAKIYNGLIEKETDQARKAVLADSLLMIYDIRMEECGEKPDVMARKAYDTYKYKVRDSTEHEAILELFDEASELNQSALPDYMMMPYADIVRRNLKSENISEDEANERFEKITTNLKNQIENASEEDKDKLEEILGNVNGMINTDDPMDCNFVTDNLGPKFQANPTDLDLAKRIFSILLKAKCTNDSLWVATGELIAENDPDFGLYKNLGVKAQAGGDLEKAEKLYKKALEYAKTNEQKAEIHIRLGSIVAEKGQYSEARKMYYEALEIDPSTKDPYTAIGYLYFNSFNTCAGKQNIVKDRAVFLAAYDMFVKGGNSQMAAQAKSQFPSKSEIFERNMQTGQSISTGCWIGETTTLRSRD